VSSLWSWPSLSGVSPGALPRSLVVEQGVWGKVHGARSDFRWIAATRGFTSLGTDIERQVTVGVEDRPTRFPLWRTHAGVQFAGTCYPSRARDAAGRGGALEKQLLAWRTEPQIPTALAALLFLPRVEELDDGAWWGKADASVWDRDSRFVLDLGASREIPVSEAVLDAAVREGISALRAALAPSSAEAVLADLFSGFLDERRPVLLPSGNGPLSPEALAVLLLPLERSRGARLSLSGWLPSARPPGRSLGERWDLVACAAEAAGAGGHPAADPRGRRMAEALLAGDPSLLQQARGQVAVAIPIDTRSGWGEVEVDVRGSTSPEALEMSVGRGPLPQAPTVPEPPDTADRAWWLLYDFVRDPQRFWLDPRDLAPYLEDSRSGDGAPAVQTALAWLGALDSNSPAGTAGEQHQTKRDLLRAAILALSPTAATYDALVSFRSERVPPLLYLASAPPRAWERARRTLGDARFAGLLEQSREGCAPELRPRIEDRLGQSRAAVGGSGYRF